MGAGIARIRKRSLTRAYNSLGKGFTRAATPLKSAWWRAAPMLGALSLTAGCGLADGPISSPKGPIALAERDLLFTAFFVMLIVVIPVFLLTIFIVRRYRASNEKARYDPEWESGALDAVVWLVPAAIVVTLGVLTWTYAHKLDPYRPLKADQAPLEVQVIAQDWKWLFIYPEQQIATVNELVFPSGRPLSLAITSDTVMNSFFIPALGGQIYAMAGMRSELHLLADAPGRFRGRNMQYSGSGFSDQNFTAIATTEADFDAWVDKVRKAPQRLDAAAYQALAKPSKKHPVTYYAFVEPKLFDAVVVKFASCAAPRTGQETQLAGLEGALCLAN